MNPLADRQRAERHAREERERAWHEMEQLRARLANLYEIRDSGVQRRKIGEALDMTYRSDAELLAAINDIERRLGMQNVSRTHITIHGHKGWNRRHDW
jgi:hypothetical protein